MKNRRTLPLIVYLLALVLIFSWASRLFEDSLTAMPYSEVVKLFENEQVKSFVVEEQTITMELHTPYQGQTQLVTSLADPASFRQEMGDLLSAQMDSGVLESYHFVPDEGFSPYELVLPLLAVGVVLYVVAAVKLKAITRADCLLLPKGKKIADLLHL